MWLPTYSDDISKSSERLAFEGPAADVDAARDPVLLALRSAVQNRDGPRFLDCMSRVNDLLRSAKVAPPIAQSVWNLTAINANC